MKHISLAGAVAIIVLTNAFALLHAARNRMGSTDAELTLTNRELGFHRSASDDNSGVTLRLEWTTRGDVFSIYGKYGNTAAKWLKGQKLQALGFDCSVDPTGGDAERFYQRQGPRRTFVALEYDGPAWRAWLDAYHNAMEQQARIGSNLADSSGVQSRLIPIDADSDADALRTRYPNRSSILIVPGVVSIALVPYVGPREKPSTNRARRLEGYIQEIASSIHVPLPFSDEFQRRDGLRNDAAAGLGYSVHLRYGALHEPWVTGVELSKP